MKERLSNIIHLIGCLLSLFLFYQGTSVESQYSIFPNNLSPAMGWLIMFIPILVTWSIKYILTGNKELFPTFK